jgi:hypothetical protein
MTTASPASAATSLKVTGPIRGGAHGWPFGGALQLPQGYVEEEYFVEGVATRYEPVGELGEDGKWTVQPAGQAPFKTRVVVRRPIDPGKFNGTLVCGWTNVSGGFDVLGGEDEGVGVYENGFAFAAISAQRAGVHGAGPHALGLIQWDPQRYGSLSVPSDALSYDIFTQVAPALGPDRATAAPDPMGGLTVKRMIAVGGSQSGMRLTTYANAIQPRDGVFDAIMPLVGFGKYAELGDTPPLLPRSGAPIEELLGSFRQTRIRDDLGIPVMIVLSETESEMYAPVRQPDTATFRMWEVAGSSHTPTQAGEHVRALLARDGIPVPGAVAGETGVSDISSSNAYDAALLHVQKWITTGAHPPTQPKIEMAGSPPRIVRDALGNAKGGVRLPKIEAPLAQYIGMGGEGGVRGERKAFSPEQLKRFYPDRAAYLAKFKAAADAAVQAGVLLPAQAQADLEEAEAVSFPS